MAPKPDWTFTVRDEAAAADVAAVVEGLVGFNLENAPAGPAFQPLFVRAHTDGALAGGLNGSTYWRWLHVRHLWVHADFRRGGLGRELLTSAETEAKQRGCVGVELDTFSFQARGFYGRMGYAVFGTLDDCPPGHSRYFMYKRIAS